MMSPQPHAVSKDLQTALARFGVTFSATEPIRQTIKDLRSTLYDSMGLWIGGTPVISAWGPACGRGIAYKDMGVVTDGQKGAIRKISTGRKARGMASDGLKAVTGLLEDDSATD
jgi:hypothetical protein